MYVHILRAAVFVLVFFTSFRVFAAAPTATTSAATSITTSSAILNGAGVPNGEATTGWFRISSTSPGTCNDTFGTRVPATGGTDLGSGAISVPYSITTTGLSGGVTYYFCAIVSNASGTAFGSVFSFTVPAAPTVVTNSPTNVTSVGATLQGSASPGASATTGWFRYSTTNPGTCSDTFGTRAPTSGGSSLGSGTSSVDYSFAISGLTPGATYYYCAIASNAYGTSFGAVLSFTAPPAVPVVTTSSGSSPGTQATMFGSANPGGAATLAWFRYATTSPGTCNDTFGTKTGVADLLSGNSSVAFSESIFGLSQGTTYYFCAIASNSAGTGFGAVLSFTTPSLTVTTSAATLVTSTTATFNGSANPRGDATTGWFRYGTTSPGSCNDSFGTRAPATGGTSLGAGFNFVAYSQAITGLSPLTTYYYCAIAQNSFGTAYGSLLTFTTPAAPVVTTSAATSVTNTTATLNGSANPNLAATTGYFRYSLTNPGTCDDAFGSRAPATGGTSLGAGSTAVLFSQALTGLSPGTTYYYCAIASNSEGTGFGAVLSFTTPGVPAVTTTAATSVQPSSATLNGSASPNGATTTGWLRYSTTNPGTCNDTFGTRAPSTGGSSLGSGFSAVAYGQSISGLTPTTTYYYCAIASNSYGTNFGAVLSFTTPAAVPAVTTNAASLVTGVSAQLNGSANPGGDATTGWFRVATSSPGTCNDTFGTRVPATGGDSLGTGTTAVTYSEPLTGLSQGTTYYYCAIASNGIGTGFGAVQSFTTTALTVTTVSATSVTSTTATLNGSANPAGDATTAWFRYSTASPGACNDAFGTRAPASGGSSLGSGNGGVAYSQGITGLSPLTTYYYCAIAQNSFGTKLGSLLTFTTPGAPLASTAGATGVTSTTATINGSGNPNGAATTGYFRFSLTSPGTCDDTFGSRAPASGGASLGTGSTYVSFSQSLTGLSAGTTYYYCAIASSSEGTGFGTVMSFTTPGAPTVTTTAATAVTSSSATINGSANPNGASTTGWLRYSTTNPGTCSDTFGFRVPSSGGSTLGSGFSAVAFGQSLTGLTPGTTYYYCAIASNSYGTALGSVLSFTTLAAAPTVTTSSATSLTGTSATLRGSANPGGDATTGWFRYSTASPGSCNDTFGTRAPATGGSSLGAGTSSVAFSQGITGLTAGTTYYYCAIAQNSVGIAFGSVVSFTTPLPPAAATSAATGITNTAATLNGSGIANGSSTTGYFRYSLTDPGACDDTFGSRAPATGGTSLGSGYTAVSFSQSLTGLSAGTTYYYCAIATSSEGTAFGAVMSFTTQGPPSVTTNAATAVAPYSAMLNGAATPNLAASYGYFRYSTANPGVCNDLFGTRLPTASTSDTSLGAGSSSVAFARSLTGLTPTTTYYYCAIAYNTYGTSFGAILSFTTPAAAPAVTTSAATLVTGTTAQLNGSANPGGSATTGWFRYATTSPGSCNDTFGTRAPATGGDSLGTGTTAVTYSEPLTGLAQGTTYYFCAIALNDQGTSFGSVLTFTTPAMTVTTNSASLVTSTTAQLNGSANPAGDATTGWFRYSTASPGSCNDSFGTRAPASGGSSVGAGNSSVAFSQAITGLSPLTTYYVCAIAQNSFGTKLGSLLTFTTPSSPVATTSAATSITNTTATLNGSGNPNGAATTGYFRYALTNPGTCDDTFGSRAPATGGTSLGSGNTAVLFSQALTGLSAGTTYYFCAIATSAEGTGFGAVLSFTTPGAPAVTTTAATSVAPYSATLNGTASPNGATTTGWYRYSTTNPGTCNDTFGTRAPATGGSTLGSGFSAVAFGQSISGLTPTTTYYYCAIASNTYGTAFGAVLSFTTPAALPVVTTNSASAGGTSATLYANANPGGDATTGWFRYSTASPGTCNDTFGTRAPATGGASLGSGTTVTSYNQAITGLSQGTTYYYCAIASNGQGTGFGAVLSFTTTALTVTTSAATLVTSTTAQLNGSANPAGDATTGWFRYSTTSPGACNDAFGTRAPATGGSSLGSGNGSVVFSQAITGLSPLTTYYVCAIAQNSFGTKWGSLLTFTTPSAPTVTTSGVTGLSNTAATLNGSGNPNGAATTGYFRYSLTDPGACDDTFGSRAPASGGSSLGSGNTALAFSQALTGLSAATKYFYCAIATSSEGTAFGAVMSFTTQGPPVTTTTAATSVTSTSATLNGSANPYGVSTTGWFRYSTTNPGTCSDTFGFRAPSSGGSTLGSGYTATSFAQSISGLTPGTTYYFCAIASNAYGTTFGAVLSFSTPAAQPSVTTSSATAVTTTTATLNASGNPNGDATTGWFRYATASPGTCNDTFGTRAPATGGSSLGAGTSSVAFSQAITGLTPNTTYYYCAIDQNSLGTAFGSILSFKTTAPPTVTTLAATPVTSTTATLNAQVNPNGYAATGWFRYSTTNPGTCDTTFGSATATSALGSGTTAVPLAQSIGGLTPATTYYFCAIAQSSIGTTLGEVLSFTTPAAPPIVTTTAASDLTDTSATLNATVNPNGADTTGWFRYSTTNPGTCNDTFGTRAPTTGGTSVGAGNTPVTLSLPVSSLSAGTTYYYCALVTNSVGSSVGSIVSFTTAALPSVTTSAATSVTTTGATLNGSANPRWAATTGWFRYDTTNPGSCNDIFGTRAPGSGGSSLGSGSSAVSYSQAITGLTPGVTYYYCAIAQNVVGTGFGTVMSFTTPAVPVVTTSAPTSVTSTGATLNGSANPNLLSATGWFRWSATSPGTCNDTFGTRVPATGGTALGSGGSAVAYSQAITGLSSGTTYYYCAIASNSVGTGFGTVMSFTTPGAPTVITVAATSVTSSGATLDGSASPNQLSATGWFRFSTTNPGSCNDTFGTRTPATGGTALGAGSSPVDYSEAITGLSQGTTYYYCAIASNAQGTRFGAVMSFTTASAPSVTTSQASFVDLNSWTLNGTANPNGFAATGWFRYSTTNPGTCDDAFGTRVPTSGGTSLGAGTSPVDFPQTITGLATGTTYYYCAIAENAVGKSFGAVLSFSTASAPTVTTDAALSVTSTGATLHGWAAGNYSAPTAWFRWSTTNPGTCDDTFGTRAPAAGGTVLGPGTTPDPFVESLTGLTPGTTYYYCAIAQNAVGMGFGAVVSFTTAGLPAVTTTAATSVTGTSATLNGSANPRGSAATGWFRYSATNPGSCDDTFGTRAPTSGGTSLGSGTGAVPYSQAITGLSSGTTYYYCAIASNSEGAGFGEVLSFTTAAPPTVTTETPTSVTGTGATLNGTGNPNQLSATGWFRYSTVSPGSCNDVFGIRAPATGGTALGSGSTPAPFSQAITGLTPGMTYYTCAIASNTQGTRFGAVLSFTTPAPPAVTTSAATAVTSTGATLNGSANPISLATDGWFRYSPTNPGSCNDTFGTRAPAAGGTSLGSGATAVPYSQPITGLVAGTTYYYCAIASNAAGTGFGAVASFTAPAAPAVTTTAATSVASTSATLNGAANPGGAAATGWFRISATDPGTCDDTFGTRTPASLGTSLGSGGSAVAYSVSATGLTAGTTYYYCAIAQNSEGTSFGAVMSFTTASAPIVTSTGASGVTATGATLNGTASPQSLTATGWFRYSTTNPGACDDTFGTRAPATGGTALGSGPSAVPYAQTLAGLTSGMTYYFCAIASNSAGTGFGAVQSFTTAGAPVVTTEAATAVTSTSANLNGTGNPNQLTSTGWFRYSTVSPGSCNDTFGARVPTTGGVALGAGSTTVPYSLPLTGLTPGMTYYYCAVASNAQGTRFGAVQSFTLPSAPTVTTVSVTAVTSTGASFNGSASPNQVDTTAWFRYDTQNPGSCNDTFGTRAPTSGGTSLGNGTTVAGFSQSVTGLTPGATYYFCAIAQNSIGTGFGAVLSFTTPAPPLASTSPATSVTSTGATLNGSANPNLDGTTAWFRYSATDPGTCDDTFGTRAPATLGTSVGNGSGFVPYSEVLTGLAPATTYYYCAIAQSSLGTSFGAVLSFTTTALPSVVTSPASGVTDTAATLNGSANPNLAATTGWFRYSMTNPGSCDDTFGTRAPLAGGTSVGAGASPVPYSQSLTGLLPGTSYYYCAIAQSSIGTSFGAVLSFSTPAAPTVMTVGASSVTSTGATFEGSAIPNLDATTGWFRFSTTSPGSCNDTFGTRAPVTGGSTLGAGTTPVLYAQSITGLTPATTYYFCAIAQNAVGTKFGAVLSFETPGAPTVTTEGATSVSSTGATLNGSANPNLGDTTGWFRYDTTSPGSCDDSFGTRAPSSGGTALGSGSSPAPYSQSLTGLLPGTTYYYCAIADNGLGTSFGPVMSFTTPGAPVVTTTAATSVSTTSATINGSANPSQGAATGWFRYDTTDPGTCDDTFGTRAPATGGTSLGSGSSPVPYFEALTGLLPATTYYYCAIAENALGKGFGEVLSFTTSAIPAVAPSVTTKDASDLTSTAATINGSANPNQAASTGWFRYDTTDPGTCDDTFGTRVPATGGTDLGAGSSAVDYSESLTGLTPGTTYYFCAIAENANGTSFGEVLSFTTPADLPTVTTDPPTEVKDTSATLNGTATPNGGDTTAWFRYDTTDPGACDDTFGVRAPASGGSALGNGLSPVAFSQPITGLTAGTTVYYCAIAENAQGKVFGEIVSFVPSAAPPTVTTEAATKVKGTTATIAGTANPNGSDATGWFRYGDTDPGSCDDSFGTRVPETGGAALGAGTDPAPFTQALTGLKPKTKYYYCAAASNLGGAAFGEVLSFTTADVAPTVTTKAAVVEGAGKATLNGTANPNGSDAVGWFRYDKADPGKCDDEFGTRVPAADGTALGAGTDEVPFDEALSGLPKGTYYFCAIGSNAAGKAYGEVMKLEITKGATSLNADGGCGCRVDAGSGQAGSLVSLAALLLLAARRRRRAA